MADFGVIVYIQLETPLTGRSSSAVLYLSVPRSNIGPFILAEFLLLFCNSCM